MKRALINVHEFGITGEGKTAREPHFKRNNPFLILVISYSRLLVLLFNHKTNLIIQSIIKMIENQQKKEELKRAKWNIFKVYGISLFR